MEGTHSARPRAFRTLLAVRAIVVLCLVGASCGVEPGYSKLEVRYDGVPIDLEAASNAARSTTDGAKAPSTLTYVDDAPGSPVSSTTTIPEAQVAGNDEPDHGAHRAVDPTPEQAAEEPTDEILSADSDAQRRNARQRALNSFRGLVANATKLDASSVDCLVEEVRRSKVNPVPMNRVLRRALEGRAVIPAPRYVALANEAASACGVSLSESVLR